LWYFTDNNLLILIKEDIPMALEENKAIIRRYYEAFEKGNLDTLEELIAPNAFFNIHVPGLSTDLKSLKQLITMERAALHDLYFTIEDIVAEGDIVATRWTGGGTHKGDWAGIPPTGKQVTVTGIGFFRMADAKIVEDWTHVDMLGLMQQLGAVPPPGQAGG